MTQNNSSNAHLSFLLQGKLIFFRFSKTDYLWQLRTNVGFSLGSFGLEIKTSTFIKRTSIFGECEKCNKRV